MKTPAKILINTFCSILFLTVFFTQTSFAQSQNAKEFMYILVSGTAGKYKVIVSSTTGIYETSASYDVDDKSLKGPADFTPVLNTIKKYAKEGWSLQQFSQPSMQNGTYILSK